MDDWIAVIVIVAIIALADVINTWITRRNKK